MDGIGGLAGWRWIFILEGMATVLIALTSSIFLPADIGTAKFLNHEERQFARKFSRRHSYYSGLICVSVRRLMISHGPAMTAPLSEPSQRITRAEAAPELGEKGEEIKTEEVPMEEALVVDQANEKFEWGEVMRGNTLLSLCV